MRSFLTAKQAADELGVTLATLYAYTSRGQLRSDPVPGDPRARRYSREDVDRLKGQKEARRDPAKAAARGLHWGTPVLESSITLIAQGRLYYRGQDAVKLAETATLEEAAQLLWATPTGVDLFSRSKPLPARVSPRLRGLANDPFTMLQAALPITASRDAAAHDLRPAAVRQTGARILRFLAAAIAKDLSPVPIHAALQKAWCPRNPAAGEVIRAALVVCADHELNISAFTARCAASAGATPYDAVSAAMATLRGHKHGGASEVVAALFEESAAPGSAKQAIANRLRRGERIRGFGHPLYPDGDPRAELLLRLAKGGEKIQWRRIHRLWQAGVEMLHEAPNVDFALLAIARAFGMPAHAPLMLFFLGRTAGWIGHAIEEYEADELIRPRARYTGEAPRT